MNALGMNALVPPLPRPFLSAGWHHLVMLNFEIEPALLAPYLTRGLEIDCFEGRTFVSIVGFRFVDTRVCGIALPWHRSFDEVNLRFYVKREVAGQTRRGVMFIKELVPRRLVSWVARVFYNENYATMPMRSRVVLPEADRAGVVEYAWRYRERWHRLSATIAGEPVAPAPGSEAEFITEHYWGYSRQRDGGTLEYQVEHPPWRVWMAQAHAFDCDAAALYDPRLAPVLGCRPSSAFVAEGSPVVVRRGVRVACPESALAGAHVPNRP
jgi:uncharacterized protein YqjF (DUF2071 family)